MAIQLPRMTVGTTWSGPLLVDAVVAAAFQEAFGGGGRRAVDEARVAYMRSGVVPDGVRLTEDAQVTTLRPLTPAEAAEARDAAGLEPMAWSYHLTRINKAVAAEVDAVFVPDGQTPPEGSDPRTLRVCPPEVKAGNVGAEAAAASRAAWLADRADAVEEAFFRHLATGPEDAREAFAAHLGYQTRLRIERVSRAMVAMQPEWPGATTPDIWRAAIWSLGVDRRGGGEGAELAAELAGHLDRVSAPAPKA